SNIVIIFDSIPYFKDRFKDRGAKIYSTFRKLNFFDKVLLRLANYFKVGFLYKFMYDKWIEHLTDAKVFLVFATKNIHHLEYIRKHNPSARIILWYWNPVEACYDISKIDKTLCEKWSFDPQDCKNFGIQFNTTFYFNEIKAVAPKCEYDLFFLGLDKGRELKLKMIEEDFSRRGVRPYFYIVKPKDKDARSVTYVEYLSYLAKSKAVFDFVQEGQMGLTVRVMESLFLDKKLVTTNKDIRRYDFYRPDNIFILGEDNPEALLEFINSPYLEVDKEIVAKYDVANWIARFF